MRLTNEIRSTIINAAVAKAFGKRDAAYEKSRTQLADALYAHTYGKHERYALKLPKNWSNYSDVIDIKCEGFNWRGGNGVAASSLKLSRTHPFPQYVGDDVSVDKKHALYASAQAVANECRAIEVAKQELRTKLRTLLYSVTTSERLHEEWPDGKTFFPTLPAKVMLPVPFNLTRDINAMLRLAA